MRKDIHRLTHTAFCKRTQIHTLYAKCGYFETFDLSVEKKIETGFVQHNYYTCEECKKVEGLELLRNL